MQAGVGLLGFLCVALGSPWAYYREYLPSELIVTLAQCILLYGIWRSFYPRARVDCLQLAAVGLIALLALLSTLNFAAAIPPGAARLVIIFAHGTGYIFCAIAFAMTMTAWMRGKAWSPSAARIMIGYAITTAATFGIEQTEAIVGWNHRLLYYAPQIFYLTALLIWNSAAFLDQPKTFSPAEVACLERQLVDALGTALAPGAADD